jgi:UDP-N-acetylmuramate--alanine ligase
VTEAPWSGRRLHLIGVGGAGMSAYARAAAQLGASVTGSDQSDSSFAQGLAADGVLEPLIGHRAENIPTGDGVEVVHSSAIAAGNVELVAARERGLAVLTRAELLGQLSALRRTIAVAGAHGKTTTASMIAVALRAGGLDPGYLIGGSLRETGRGGDWGGGEWLVIEADESDRSLLSLSVEVAVLLNVELDHHDRFGSLAELEQVYREFLAHAREAVIWDRPELLALRGEGSFVAYDADPELTAGGSRFELDGVSVTLGLPGAHNARNAAAALSAARLAGVDLETAASALATFSGVARRFELLGHSAAGAAVYDDYAHHPGEIAASLAAARTLAPARLVAAFQPHLYSRTRALRREFGAALAGADVVAVLDVYPARERAGDFPGVSGLLVAEATADAAPGKAVYWLRDRDSARAALEGMLRSGDLLLVMGAGDIDELGRSLLGDG